MSIDVRRGHGRRARELAADLFERGRGYESAARGLGIPAGAVRKWMYTYRSVGREGLLGMGRKRPRYGLETKLAAARAVVEDGMPRSAAMERHGVASASSLDRWCRAYREGGEGALGPRPGGGPRGAAAPATREEELEREVRRLEAHVAYLKKSIALKAELRSRAGRRP